jgi:hypothetical protein
MKSHAKFTSLWQRVNYDSMLQCATTQVDATRDYETVLSRVKHEGLSFLTITLPTFTQGLERALEKGMVTHDEFPGWKFTKCLPAFLRGFTSLVFSISTGELLASP